MAYPTADHFVEGLVVIAVKEIHPKIPVDTFGRVILSEWDTNMIHIEWNIPTWPYVRVTHGTPTDGYRIHNNANNRMLVRERCAECKSFAVCEHNRGGDRNGPGDPGHAET
jgi:hypothetical protein